MKTRSLVKTGVAAVVLAVALTACGGGGGTPESAARPTLAPKAEGLPDNWQALAVDAARRRIRTCAQANELAPHDCPQVAEESYVPGTIPAGTQSVHWRLVQKPLPDPVVVPEAPRTVTVYGRYEMSVAYTESGQSIRPYNAYSGGLTAATMTWDGSAFQNVTFSRLVVGGVPTSVSVPVFRRPNPPSDAAVLTAVRAGFDDCVTIQFPAPQPAIPDCPQFTYTDDRATSATWTLNGDPMQGALVNFKPESGEFTVTGSYDMNLHYVVGGDPSYLKYGPHDWRATGSYTATLIWDGKALELLDIAG